jgi:antitoxin MazE
MKTRIVRIGNSQGVRIPKPLLEQAGLDGEVELRITESGIVIESASPPRAGWGSAASTIREAGEDGLVDQPVATDFDDSEWTW